MTPIRIPRPAVLIAINTVAVAALILFTPTIISDENAIVVQALRVAASLTIVIAYGMSIWEERGARIANSTHVFIFGIFMAFLGDLVAGSVSIGWRLVGKPDQWATHSFWILGAWLTIIAALHHLVAPGVVDGRIPKRSAWLIGISVGIAAFIAAIVIALNVYQPAWWWWDWVPGDHPAAPP